MLYISGLRVCVEALSSRLLMPLGDYWQDVEKPAKRGVWVTLTDNNLHTEEKKTADMNFFCPSVNVTVFLCTCHTAHVLQCI